MKHTFTSREISHIWAHSSDSFEYGKSTGNASFQQDVFYSYATVIGRRISYKGKRAFVLDRASFSNSTSKVQSRLAQSVSNNFACPAFEVHVGKMRQTLEFTAPSLKKHYEDCANEIMSELPSRYAFKRAEQFERASQELQNAKNVAEHFGLAHTALDKKLSKREAQKYNAANILKEYRTKRVVSKEKDVAKQLKQRAERNLAAAQDFINSSNSPTSYRILDGLQEALNTLPADIRAAYIDKAQKNNSIFVERWRQGDRLNGFQFPVVMLRVDENEMETSKGARVPLADAERTFRFANSLRAKGWHRNGETHNIGNYQIDAINEFGVVAGCHRVSWDEIDRFAKSQNWV